MNYLILDNKIITSKYVLDMFDFIEKSSVSKDKKEKILFNEFQKIILQTKCTFGYTYTDNEENRLRGRVNNFSGFRHGTQRLNLIPSNRWPVSRSKDQTCIRYYDFGRMDWRSCKKNRFVVATSFWDEKNKKWVDDPTKIGLTTSWKKINELNKLTSHKRTNNLDSVDDQNKKVKIDRKEEEKRIRQIKNEMSRNK